LSRAAGETGVVLFTLTGLPCLSKEMLSVLALLRAKAKNPSLNVLHTRQLGSCISIGASGKGTCKTRMPRVAHARATSPGPFPASYLICVSGTCQYEDATLCK
jgi:hypothetical protein